MAFSVSIIAHCQQNRLFDRRQNIGQQTHVHVHRRPKREHCAVIKPEHTARPHPQLGPGGGDRFPDVAAVIGFECVGLVRTFIAARRARATQFTVSFACIAAAEVPSGKAADTFPSVASKTIGMT